MLQSLVPGGDERTSWIGHHSSLNIYTHTLGLLNWSCVLWSNCLFVVVKRWRLMFLADWVSKSQRPQHTIAKTETSETDAKERDTHARERESRRARWRLKRENKQQRLGRNSYTFCAGMGADFPSLLHKQHSWNFCPIPLRVVQQIWDFTTVQIPHPLPPSPAFFFFLFFFISGFSFLFLFYLSTSLAPETMCLNPNPISEICPSTTCHVLATHTPPNSTPHSPICPHPPSRFLTLEFIGLTSPFFSWYVSCD